MTMNHAPLALIVDDDRLTRARLHAHLAERGFRTIETRTASEAVQAAAINRPPLILLDGLLPETHGFEVARMIHAIHIDYHPRILMMTAIYKHLRYHNEAKLTYGIAEYLTKPLDFAEVDAVIGAVALEMAS